MKVVVLGGAGKMGCISVQDLAGDERVSEVVIADRDLTQARIVAETLGSSKITIQAVDASDHGSLLSVLRGADVCVNATVYYFNYISFSVQEN